MASDGSEPQEHRGRLSRSQANLLATGGVSATAGVSAASIVLSLGTEGAAVVVAAIVAAIAGTLSALGRRRR